MWSVWAWCRGENDFCCNIQMVKSESDINNMKRSILPCISGSLLLVIVCRIYSWHTLGSSALTEYPFKLNTVYLSDAVLRTLLSHFLSWITQQLFSFHIFPDLFILKRRNCTLGSTLKCCTDKKGYKIVRHNFRNKMRRLKWCENDCKAPEEERTTVSTSLAGKWKHKLKAWLVLGSH